MTRTRRLVIAAGAAASLIASGATGAVITASLMAPTGIALAASTSTPAATQTPASGAQGAAPAAGTFKPNEDPAHEAGESAAREAQEDAGQVPNVP